MHALEVRNLRKQFGSVTAVDDVSFEIPEGVIFGLLGRNGAGKTTTIRMMMDIYKPDAGEVLLRGVKAGEEFNSNVGYLPEERGLYQKMTVMDTLLFFAELKGKKGPEIKQQAVRYLEQFDLGDRMKSKLADLSKGNQQKVQFISTILHDPEFVVLDEPFSGLDPVNTSIIRDMILDLKRRGKVIIFSTHLMDFADRMCDNICLIHKGKALLNGPLSEIRREFGNRNVTVQAEGDLSFLRGNPIVETMEDFGNTTGILVKQQDDIQTLLKLLVENNIVVKRFDAHTISLHEIFVRVAGDDVKSGGANMMEGSHV